MIWMDKERGMETPTIYISGGKIGDFIQQLSIIYEKFLLDKKPAILFLSDRGDVFHYGIEKAYSDLIPIVSRQPYIKEFKLYQGETYDVDLSSWRRHMDPFRDNYLEWMKKEYSIEWGKHKWLHNIPMNPIWKYKVVVNTTHNRFPTMINWKKLYHQHELVFVGFEKGEHDHFIQTTDLHTPFYKPHSFIELCIIIHSCQLFVGSLSSPLSLAFGLHVPLQIGFYHNPFDLPAFYNIGKHISSTCDEFLLI